MFQNNPDSCLYRLHYYQEFPANEQVLDRLIQKLEKKNTIRLKGNDKFETRIYEPLKPDERFKAHQVIYTDMDYYVSQKGTTNLRCESTGLDSYNTSRKSDKKGIYSIFMQRRVKILGFM